MRISLETGDFGTYVVKNDVNDEEVFVQTDSDFPRLAKSFGWDGDEKDIQAATYFLDEIADTSESVEDPGYFDHTEDDLTEPEDDEFDFNDYDSYGDDEPNQYGF